MQAVGYAVSEAGIRAKLYWYHDAGYFEEFLGHKKGEYGYERMIWGINIQIVMQLGH